METNNNISPNLIQAKQVKSFKAGFVDIFGANTRKITFMQKVKLEMEKRKPLVIKKFCQLQNIIIKIISKSINKDQSRTLIKKHIESSGDTFLADYEIDVYISNMLDLFSNRNFFHNKQINATAEKFITMINEEFEKAGVVSPQVINNSLGFNQQKEQENNMQQSKYFTQPQSYSISSIGRRTPPEESSYDGAYNSIPRRSTNYSNNNNSQLNMIQVMNNRINQNNISQNIAESDIADEQYPETANLSRNDSLELHDEYMETSAFFNDLNNDSNSESDSIQHGRTLIGNHRDTIERLKQNPLSSKKQKLYDWATRRINELEPLISKDEHTYLMKLRETLINPLFKLNKNEVNIHIKKLGLLLKYKRNERDLKDSDKNMNSNHLAIKLVAYNTESMKVEPFMKLDIKDMNSSIAFIAKQLPKVEFFCRIKNIFANNVILKTSSDVTDANDLLEFLQQSETTILIDKIIRDDSLKGEEFITELENEFSENPTLQLNKEDYKRCLDLAKSSLLPEEALIFRMFVKRMKNK